MSSTRRGRRAGGSETEEQILHAAQREFADKGYQKTTMRSIATLAGVDTKLVHYYFGTKPELFATAISMALDAQSLIDVVGQAIESGRKDRVGAHLIAGILTRVETAPEGVALQGLLRNLGNHEESRQVFLGFIRDIAFANVLPLLGEDRPEQRMGMVISQLFGIIFSRVILQLSPITAMSIDEVAKAGGPTLDRYLFGPM